MAASTFTRTSSAKPERLLMEPLSSRHTFRSLEFIRRGASSGEMVPPFPGRSNWSKKEAVQTRNRKPRGRNNAPLLQKLIQCVVRLNASGEGSNQ